MPATYAFHATADNIVRAILLLVFRVALASDAAAVAFRRHFAITQLLMLSAIITLIAEYYCR